MSLLVDGPVDASTSARQRQRILAGARSVALVGVSSKAARPSNFVATYLLSSSCELEVWFVNPRETEVRGHPVYPSLADLPVVPDIVDAFRRPDDLPDVAREAVAIGAQVFWMQLGLRSDEAAAIALAGGLDVVQDRCVKIEHARFHGGLHLAGFDTGVIDSRKR